MQRRDFLGLTRGALACAALSGGGTGALGQRVFRVVVVTPSQAQWQPRAFRDALRDAGYRENENLRIDIMSGESDLARLPKIAADAVASRPDVIVAVNTPGTRAAMAATSSIPIVSAAVADPVFIGIVDNLARPGGNVTGVANLGADFTSKRILLLKEIAPTARRIALFMHPDEPIAALQVQEAERNAATLGIEPRAFAMRTGDDLALAMREAAAWNAQAVVRLAGQGFALGADTGRLATQTGLPSMLLQRRDVEAGGLMSYFTDQREVWRLVGAQVDRLLKGATPRDLPFELPTRFELAVNLATARKLGLAVPPSLLAQADDVIE